MRRVLAAALIGLAVSELPYLNWRPVAAPLDARPLIIRQDAKGDGRFLSPRSGNRRHRGIDLVAGMGSPVRAIRSGRVVEAGLHRGLGRFVTLEHPRRLRSRYAHLKTTEVAVGQRVRQGQVIGTVGKTGNARHAWITPHLHLEVLDADPSTRSARSGSRDEQPIDPRMLGLDVVEPATSRVGQARAGEEDDESEARGGG